MSKRRSKVWHHFSAQDDKLHCIHCSRHISTKGGSTANLFRHLRLKHPDIVGAIPNIVARKRTSTSSTILIVEPNEPSTNDILKKIKVSASDSIHIEGNKLSGIYSYSTPSFTTLSVTVPKEFVYHVQLNRPEKRNAINIQMWNEIKACFEALNEDEDCRSIVLSGHGQHFCAGIDISDLTGILSDFPTDDVARRAKVWHKSIVKLQGCISSLEECKKPVLAAVHSACVGAGVDMITAADMRYCTKDAWFQVKEVDLGLAADVGTLQRLPKVLGSESLVRELCFTARKMESQEALERGLVTRVYETQEEMMTEVINIAEEIAKKSPVAIQGTKVSLVYARDHSVQEGLNQIAMWNQAMLQSEDLVEAAMGQMSKNRNIQFSKL